MLIYILIAIVVIFITLFFIVNKSKKKPHVSRKSSKQKLTPSTSKDTHPTHLNSDETHQKITSLINDRNFFAAEVQIKEWINKNQLLPQPYLLLVEVYLLQNDELSIQELLEQLNTENYQPILQLVKTKLKDNNNVIETIEFNLPSQSDQIIKKLKPESVKSDNEKTEPLQDLSLTTNNKTPINDDLSNIIEVKNNDHQTIISTPIDPLLDAFPELEQTNEISLNLELAEKYIELGAYEEAKRLIEEKEESYNATQRDQANKLLKQIAS